MLLKERLLVLHHKSPDTGLVSYVTICRIGKKCTQFDVSNQRTFDIPATDLLDVSGSLPVTDLLDVSGSLPVTDLLDVSGSLPVTDLLDVSGSLLVTDLLDVSGSPVTTNTGCIRVILSFPPILICGKFLVGLWSYQGTAGDVEGGVWPYMNKSNFFFQSLVIFQQHHSVSCMALLD